MAFPLFNLVAGARLDPNGAGEVAVEVAGEFIARGLPWMWWTTPSHTSQELEDALIGLGLVAADTPGMHAELDSVPAAEASLEAVEVSVDDPDFGRVFIEGFGLPEFVLEPLQDLLRLFETEEQVAVLVRADGRPAGVASGLFLGDTIGIYNVTTLDEHRGRGVGSAATAAVMRAGAERGCTNAILHSSEMGRGVYHRLGFREVCATTQWVWEPL